MIKLSANVSKKVPIEGLQYSSQNFSAGIEVEVSGDRSEERIRDKFRKLYGLLEDAIDEQIRIQSGGNREEDSRKDSARSRIARRGLGRLKNDGNGNSSGGSNGNGRHATEAQVKAIYAIAKDRGIETGDLKNYLLQDYGVQSPQDLSISDASSVIDELKAVKSQ